ncbi:cation efflux protein [Microthyrium microscopicum]|uniref:Cation efflux protein n=1 Tax=Microthyrium microscopicum TaxID=703497 RepID=A0A6A6UE54_9PEZI|nr:cation efflux protein [Microthyrium microscopicum]
MTSQVRHHGGGHHHHHDNTYLVSANKNDAGVRITRIGLFVNLGMAICKGAGGYFFHSQALAADAVHSLTDLVSDFMTLAAVGWALKPPTEKFPLGYGKIESLGSLGVSGLLLVGGLLMGWSSLIDLCQIYMPAFAHMLESIGLIGCGHSHTHQIPNIQAAWLAGGSVVIKEWLYRATMKVAKERKSAVLESNAVHHRVDSLTGIAALLSIAVANMFPTFAGMDAVGGLAISFMVVRAGWGNTITSLEELADASISEEVKTKTQKVARQALADSNCSNFEVQDVSGTKAGQNFLLDVTIGVPATMTLEQLASVESVVRERIGSKVRGARRIRIRFVDAQAEEALDEFIAPSSTAASTPESEEEHHHHNGNGKDKSI